MFQLFDLLKDKIVLRETVFIFEQQCTIVNTRPSR
jgi:hypothetical protein